MNCRISDDLKELLPTFSVIAYEIEFDSNFNAMIASSEVDEYLEKLYDTIPNMYNYDEITKIPKLKATRDGYKKMGKDPSHTRPACEALLRRIVKGSKLYRLGDVIDVGNILSVLTLRSVCVVDLDKIVGDVVIRLGTKEDIYEGINRGLINVTNIPVYTDNVGPFGCPTSDTLRTCVTNTTKKVLVMIICFDESEKDVDEKSLINLYQTLTKVKNIRKIGDN